MVPSRLALYLPVAFIIWMSACVHSYRTGSSAGVSTDKYKKVQAGNMVSCGLLESGRVQCWGFDLENQFPSRASEFVDIALAKPLPRIICAARRVGKTVCWGDEIALPPDIPAKTIRTGTFYSCSLRQGGAAVCWPTVKDQSNKMKPFEIRNPAGVADVSLNEHMCFLDGNGRVACAGLEEDGDFRAPETEFTQISVGLWVACGVTKGGAVECWGYGISRDKRAGQAKRSKAQEPKWEVVAVDKEGRPLDKVIYQIKDLYRQNSPLTDLWETFSPDDYQVRPTMRRSEVRDWNLDPPQQGGFRYVSTYGSTVCAVRNTGNLVCWGECQYRMCDTPPGSFKQVDVGPMNACAIRDDGRVVCWGADEFGMSSPP